MEWQLTDKELDELRARGGDIMEAQRAKREAYLKAHREGETMEYTKGEWEVKGYPSGRYIQTNEIIIAQVWGQKPMAETEANAQLIASAPDLYEALAYLNEHCSPEMFSNYAREKCRKALAKAEGK